jgi:hypothetical protein
VQAQFLLLVPSVALPKVLELSFSERLHHPALGRRNEQQRFNDEIAGGEQ